MVKLSAAGKQALDDLVAQTVRDKKIPGFVIGASNLDEDLYFNAGGYNVYDDPASGEVNPDSVFWVCSMTKLIAAIAALQLIDQGKLDYDTPVSKYFPEFANLVVLQDPYTSETPSFKPAEKVITVFHLLSHSSGLFYAIRPFNPPYSLPVAYSNEHDEADPHRKFFEDIKGEYPGIPLTFEPGTSYAYGWSSDVVGFLVEKVTGQTLEEYCKENIFGPLGIKTTFHLTEELKERLVSLAFRNPDGSISQWADHTPLIQRYPKPVFLHLGGIGSYTSLKDYLVILRNLLQIQSGVDVSNPLLKVETVRELFKPKLTPAGAQSLTFSIRMLDPTIRDLNWSTGLAVTVDDWPGKRKKGSAFWAGWAGTFYFIDPTTGLAFVFGTQIIPTLDNETSNIAAKFEEVVYAHLE